MARKKAILMADGAVKTRKQPEPAERKPVEKQPEPAERKPLEYSREPVEGKPGVYKIQVAPPAMTEEQMQAYRKQMGWGEPTYGQKVASWLSRVFGRAEDVVEEAVKMPEDITPVRKGVVQRVSQRADMVADKVDKVQEEAVKPPEISPRAEAIIGSSLTLGGGAVGVGMIAGAGLVETLGIPSLLYIPAFANMYAVMATGAICVAVAGTSILIHAVDRTGWFKDRVDRVMERLRGKPKEKESAQNQ